MHRRDSHPSSEEPKHSIFKWLEIWWGISFGNILTMLGGVVFAMGLFFTFGDAFARNDETDTRQDAEDVRIHAEVAANKVSSDKQVERLEGKLDEMNRNIVALMVAQGIKPTGAGK